MTVIRKQEEEEEEREENWGEGKGAVAKCAPPSPLGGMDDYSSSVSSSPFFSPICIYCTGRPRKTRKNGIGFARYYYILPVAAFLLA